jgi:hypothetical protein
MAQRNVTTDTNYGSLTFIDGGGGVLTAINTWNSSIKAVLVQTKSFIYTAWELTQIVVKDGNNATTLTKTLNYSGGNLASITEDYA